MNVRTSVAVLCVLAMIAIIVSLDLTVFRNRFAERLIANVGIVLIFVAVYMRFLQSP